MDFNLRLGKCTLHSYFSSLQNYSSMYQNRHPISMIRNQKYQDFCSMRMVSKYFNRLATPCASMDITWSHPLNRSTDLSVFGDVTRYMRNFTKTFQFMERRSCLLTHCKDFKFMLSLCLNLEEVEVEMRLNVCPFLI